MAKCMVNQRRGTQWVHSTMRYSVHFDEMYTNNKNNPPLLHCAVHQVIKSLLSLSFSSPGDQIGWFLLLEVHFILGHGGQRDHHCGLRIDVQTAEVDLLNFSLIEYCAP